MLCLWKMCRRFLWFFSQRKSSFQKECTSGLKMYCPSQSYLKEWSLDGLHIRDHRKQSSQRWSWYHKIYIARNTFAEMEYCARPDTTQCSESYKKSMCHIRKNQPSANHNADIPALWKKVKWPHKENCRLTSIRILHWPFQFKLTYLASQLITIAIYVVATPDVQ